MKTYLTLKSDFIYSRTVKVTVHTERYPNSFFVISGLKIERKEIDWLILPDKMSHSDSWFPKRSFYNPILKDPTGSLLFLRK